MIMGHPKELYICLFTLDTMLSLFPPQILQPSSKDPKISSSIAADHLDSPFTIPLIVYSVLTRNHIV